MADEYEAPPEPAPFKGSEQDRKLTRQRQALFLRQALAIVERFGQNPVTPAMLFSALPWLEREQYDDIAIERNAHGNCGYVLCPNPQGEPKKQQYRICNKTRRVYDITERKPFCSDWCYCASQHIRNQISEEPGWCRPVEQLKSTEFNLLSKQASGRPGKLVLDALNHIRLTDSTCSESSDEDAKPTRQTNSQLDNLPNPKILKEIRFIKTDHLLESSNSSDTDQEQEEHVPEAPHDADGLHKAPHSTDTDKIHSLEPEKLSNEGSNLDSLVLAVHRRLREWISPRAMASLTASSDSNDRRMHEQIMRQFYAKPKPKTSDSESEKEKQEHPDDPDVFFPIDGVIPLIDSISPNMLRQQLVLDELKRKSIVAHLDIEIHTILPRLERFVLNFNLTSKNVHMNRPQSALVSLTIFYLICTSDPVLNQSLNQTKFDSLLKSWTQTLKSTFLESIIKPLEQIRFLDSDDEPDPL